VEQLSFSLFPILLTLGSITPIVDLLLILFWRFNFKDRKSTTAFESKVSILIAARNEAQNLPSSLEALLKLDYHKDKLEILIGNDASSDESLSIAQNYARKYAHIKVFDIHKQMGQVKGKANVLAQLAHEATGDVFLITDADVQVPESWVKGMMSYYTPDVGMITGITSVKRNTLWGRLQHLDWLLALGMVKVITDLTRPVTAMGNNMLVSRKAYWEAGGYENIPFSVTEDFALFQAVCQKGYQIRQVIAPEVNAETFPADNFLQLLHQRKRWMSGAMQLPFHITFLLGVQAAFFPLVITLFFFQPIFAMGLLSIKILLQALFLSQVQEKLHQKKYFFSLILYESYSIVLSLSLILFYFLPVRMNWKGRRY
jgi:cellulose synthase/poly-beta-1,6-N-acetylglucosamine synthase-like glycosyltransferase